MKRVIIPVLAVIALLPATWFLARRISRRQAESEALDTYRSFVSAAVERRTAEARVLGTDAALQAAESRNDGIRHVASGFEPKSVTLAEDLITIRCVVTLTDTDRGRESSRRVHDEALVERTRDGWKVKELKRSALPD